MSKILPLLLIVQLVVTACKKDDNGEPDPDRWITDELSLIGDTPIPDREGRRILYRSEAAGHFLEWDFDLGQATVRFFGPGVESYAWSNDGQQIVFAVTESGIFTSRNESPDLLDTVWALGIHPHFLPGDSLIICAGPEDNSDNQGIFVVNLRTRASTQISDSGSAPEVSPDGQKIAYLLPVAGLPGRTLRVYNRQTQFTQPLATNVYNYSWLNNSETIVYETLELGVQQVGLVSLASAPQLYGPGTLPAGLPDEFAFVYTAIEADTASGVMLGKPGESPVKIADTGTQLAPANGRTIYAAGPSTLLRIRPE